MRCEFLPPYSPDYNLIKLAFSAMKYYLHCNGSYMHMAMTNMLDVKIHAALLEALYQIPEADVFGWFRHWSYM
jgi:transposase